MNSLKRGDIWLVRLDPGPDGMAQPCVVLSPPEIHDFLDVVTLAPLDPHAAPAGFHPAIEIFGTPTRIVLEQISSVAKRRLISRQGAVGPKALAEALSVCRAMFAD